MRLPYQIGWALLAIGIGLPAPAQAQQALNLTVGYFTVTGEDGRVDGDVLVANRELLSFDIDDFNGPSFGAEWLHAVWRVPRVRGRRRLHQPHRAQHLHRLRRRRRPRDRAGLEAAHRADHRDAPAAAVRAFARGAAVHRRRHRLLQLPLQRGRRLRGLRDRHRVPRQLRRQRHRAGPGHPGRHPPAGQRPGRHRRGSALAGREGRPLRGVPRPGARPRRHSTTSGRSASGSRRSTPSPRASPGGDAGAACAWPEKARPTPHALQRVPGRSERCAAASPILRGYT